MKYFVSSIILIVVCTFCSTLAIAQHIKGKVTDMHSGQPIVAVYFENIYTHVSGFTDSLGYFEVDAGKGELVEFKKVGYYTARARMPMGAFPSYFMIQMNLGSNKQDQPITGKDFVTDSLYYRSLYKTALNYQKLKTYEKIQHPFTAMSKQYRKMMAFQEEYSYLEKMKYVDYNFSEQNITRITGLTDDSLARYMKMYRPSYDQLRSMSDYNFYNYIKRTATIWRRQQELGSGRISH
jgi:hypothetical protein